MGAPSQTDEPTSSIHGPIGVVVQHVSGDENGPTIGWSMRVDESNRELWCGEIPKSRFVEMPPEHRDAMRNDYGWFLVLYRSEEAGGTVVLGKVVDEYRARELVQLIGAALMAGGDVEP